MLIQALRDKQQELGLDGQGLAAELGISQAYWSQVQNGNRRPGVGFLNAVSRRFPELLPAVLSFLQSDMAEGKSRMAIRHHDSPQTHQEGQEAASPRESEPGGSWPVESHSGASLSLEPTKPPRVSVVGSA